MLTLVFFSLTPLSISFLQESIGSDFSDLGRQILAGFLVAVALAVSFTVIKLRRHDKNPPAPFISIIASESRDVPSNSRIDTE